MGWTRAVATIAVVTALAIVAMVLTGMGPRLVTVAALGALTGVSVWLVWTLANGADPAAPWGTADQPRTADRDARPRSWSLRHQVPNGPQDLRTAERLWQRLVELIDDRLLAEHGIDRGRDPAGAQAILGDDLARFATDPHAARTLTDLATVDRVVSRIEAL
jgi:hypothetical protein